MEEECSSMVLCPAARTGGSCHPLHGSLCRVSWCEEGSS